MNALQKHLQKAGRLGGKVMTPKKRRALLKNLVKANAARRRKKKEA